MRYCLAIAILVLSGWAHAHPLQRPSTILLFEKSDIVCSGVVTGVKESRPAEQEPTGFTVRHLLATVVTRDVYKGYLSAGQPILVEFTTKTPIDRPWPQLAPGENALLFLNHEEGATYVYADDQLGAMRFSSLPVEPGTDGMAKFEAVMASLFVNGQAQDRADSAMFLLTMPTLTSSTIAKISPAAKSDDPALAQWGIALAIKWDTSQGLEELKRYLAQKRIDTKDWSTMEPMTAIMGELSSVGDPRYLSGVEGLIFADDRLIRMGAGQALRNMKTKAAAPALLKLLDDPDKDIQYSAEMALAELFDKGGEYATTWPEFSKRPEYYAGLWKAWALQTGITAAK
jgi:HEAT repeat protein